MLNRLSLLLLLLLASAWPSVAAAEADDWATTVRPLLDRYCVDCHGAKRQKGDLDLQRIGSTAELCARPDLMSVLEQRLAAEEMPPSKAPQPTVEERAQLLNWLRKHAAGGGPQIADDPGVVVMPRATPTQYQRMVRDLTGLDLPLAANLPHDGGAGEGFDNLGAAQPMTPMHLQAYLAAARQVLTCARVLPGMPIKWSSWYPTLGIPQTTTNLKDILLVEWDTVIHAQWSEVIREHLRALAPLLPKPEAWAGATINFHQAHYDWLIVYLHAAWQHRHRAELGHPDWTPEQVAAAYPVPLRGEVLARLISTLALPAQASDNNLSLLDLVRRWEELPPPPAADEEIRKRCFDLLRWHNTHHVQHDNSFQWDETAGLLPGEIDPNSFVKSPRHPYLLLKEQGLRPFRFQLGKRRELYLVTTDAADGADDDVMIWENGVIVRDGHEEPWTKATVRDGAGTPVAWGSDPVAGAAKLPPDSIAVRAPAVLHVEFPEGTTEFRVDARADAVHARNGSMQAVPMDHPPRGEELHFVTWRWVMGAPKSQRMARQLDSTGKYEWNLDYGENGMEYVEVRNGLPPEVCARWRIGKEAQDETEYQRGFHKLWRYKRALAEPFMTDAHRRRLDDLSKQLLGTIEKRDLLIDFLATHQVPFRDAGDALTVAPTGLTPEQMERHRQLLADAVADEQRLLDCARAHISGFAEKAWRFTPSQATLAPMLALYQSGRDDGLCYDASIKRALEVVLASPYFLYRKQHARSQTSPYAIAGRELAERLAATLWGSLPDDELLRAGAAGELADPVALRRQIGRLVADKRARALASEFAAQAYLFAGFERLPGPDARRFPQFTAEIRAAMQEEYLRFFTALFQEDRPLTEIIDADYAIVNGPLAEFYGIPGVAGADFRRVAVDPKQRGGVLGMGAFLVSTSAPLRTSPVKRGKWTLSQLLGTPPPPPPAVVPEISTDEHDQAGQGILAQMKRHRSDPQCMSCHERIDPLGIALESFDAIGRRRTAMQDKSPVIDQDTAVDGTALQGLAGLKAYLMTDQQRRKVMHTLCAKFIGYALGRPLIPSDQPFIDRVLADLEAHGWRSSILIGDVLASPQFTRRRDEPAPAETREPGTPAGGPIARVAPPAPRPHAPPAKASSTAAVQPKAKAKPAPDLGTVIHDLRDLMPLVEKTTGNADDPIVSATEGYWTGYKSYDANGDGKLCRTELLAVTAWLQKQLRESYPDTFAELDADGDEHITNAELVKKYGVK